MPAPEQDVLVLPTTRIQMRLEPANNVFHSLVLLAKTESATGFSDWATDTLLSMSAMERQRHQLVMIGFFYSVLPRRSWPSFPAYINHLASMAPQVLQDKLMQAYIHLPCKAPSAEYTFDDIDAILASVDTFLAFLRERFTADHVDSALETRAYAYIIDPPSMQSLIVSHLNHMWDEYLADEWRRVKPMLQDSVAAFEQVDFSQMSAREATEFITGQTLSESHLLDSVQTAEQLIFVPSAHVGSYLGRFTYGDIFGIVFGARLPPGTQYYAPDLSRAEILVRLDALADDTRLRILRLIVEEGERRSQEIMQELELSQSATSRHLKQLSATGYLTERRCEGAKCYSLNLERIDDTLKAIEAYLKGS